MSESDGPTPDEEWTLAAGPDDEEEPDQSRNLLDMMRATSGKRKKTNEDPGFLVSPKRRQTLPDDLYEWINKTDTRQVIVFLYRLGNGRPAAWRILRRHELRREQLAYLSSYDGKPSYRHLDGCDGSGRHFCCAWRSMCEDRTHVDQRTLMQSVCLPTEGHETRFIVLNS